MKHETKYSVYIFFLFGMGAILLQSLVVPLMEIYIWRPDLVLVIVLLFGKRFRSMGGSSTGFILGVIQDSLTGMPVGITALPKAIVGYATGKTKSMHLEGTLFYIWFIFLILLHEIIVFTFFQYKTEVPFSVLLYSRVFPNTIYTTLMLFIINSFTGKYFND